MSNNQEWQSQAVALLNTGTMSRRDIAKAVKKPRSTVLDFLRAYESFKNEEKDFEENIHLVIPDTQMRPGISTEYLRWIGEYIVRKQPSVIVHLGDHADMPSLSSYDKGKRTAEGKRVQADIDAAIEGMEELLYPLRKLQAEQKLKGEKVYSPRMVILYGNHEDRINRHINLNPELYGFLGLEDLKYEEMGWETVPFLTPIVIDGISYCHYFPNVMTGKPLSGTAQNMLKTIGTSFTMGHRQMLDVAHRQLPSDGQRQWGLIAGAAYVHEEDYKGFQGNFHWRGVVVKHNVKNGSYDPLFVSMDWLESEYGK